MSDAIGVLTAPVADLDEGSSLQGLRNTKPEIVTTSLRSRVRRTPASRSLHIRIAQKRAVAEHAVCAVPFLVGGAVRGSMGAVGFETILHPFEDVAVHVVEPESVRRERPCWRGAIEPDVSAFGFTAQTRASTAEISVVVIELRAPWIRRRGARSRRVLPLGLGR